jgi:hypothetical protein
VDAKTTYTEISPQGNLAEWSLVHAGRVIATVKPIIDSFSPGVILYVIAWPDGRVSDLANLTRVKDAAAGIAERGPPSRNRRDLHWRCNRAGEPVAGPLVSANPSEGMS